MQGLKVGHFTDSAARTGLSVFLFDQPAIGSYWICGSAPASHEWVVLDPDNSVDYVHGLMFAGGSAYGLFAALGVMSYLTESGIGHRTLHGIVPIVPAAAIYDLSLGSPTPPSAEEAYLACQQASEKLQPLGRVGAGTGAIVGKLAPHGIPMTGGIGHARIKLASGLEVESYVVVNCVGDVRNARGELIAGARTEHGQFVNCEAYLLSGKAEQDLFGYSHTTLALVIINASFSKAELKRIAKMAVAGMARSIAPVFTRFDGDVLFCVGLGTHQASELTVGTLAAEAVRLAILDAVSHSQLAPEFWTTR